MSEDLLQLLRAVEAAMTLRERHKGNDCAAIVVGSEVAVRSEGDDPWAVIPISFMELRQLVNAVKELRDRQIP